MQEGRQFQVRPSSFRVHRSAFTVQSNRAYTLIELILTLAVLMIVLGLMRNLSDRVRRVSTEKATKQMLWRLKEMMNQYQLENHGQLPPITPLVDPSVQTPSEVSLQDSAKQNNGDLFRYLHLEQLRDRNQESRRFSDDPLLGGLHRFGSESMVVVDSWDSPIVFMAREHPAVGMAPGNAFFFCSAGPDRAFLTHEDNLYSYDGN